MKIVITLLRTKAPYWVSLLEFAESVGCRLERMGHHVVYAPTPVPGYQQIVFGAHVVLYEPETAKNVDPNAIIYCIEQLQSCALGKMPAWYNFLKTHKVWTYAPTCVDILKAKGIETRYVPIGYVPELERYQVAENPSIDVAFVGSLNQRRIDILQGCHDAGLQVWHKFPVFGKDRDIPCANAKICMNTHFYMPGIFEIQRVIYWTSNRQFVLSENNAEQEYFKNGGIVYADYDKLLDTARDWVNRPKDRKDVAERGYQETIKMDVSDHLTDGLK